MKKLLSVACLIALFVFISSCNSTDCYNKNPVFSQFKPEQDAYKRELAKQLRISGQANLSYSFEHYVKRGGEEFILVKIKGDNLCASAELTVTDWTKISGMRRDPSGYTGAALRGLKIAIKEDQAGTRLIFDGLEKVID